MAKYFTADLHHLHKKIVDFTDRKLVTTSEDHTEWLTYLWNRQVQKGDLVCILGDVSFSNSFDQTANFLSKLNGNKQIIKGNHDRSDLLDKLVDRNVISKWDHYGSTKIVDVPTILFHYPIASWDRQRYGSFHLHGHSHGGYTDGKGKILDVGIDNAYKIFGEHRLFSEEDVIHYMHQREIYIVDSHRSNEQEK